MDALAHILHIARHDLKIALKDRTTLLWLFIMPPIFFFFIGSITGGRGIIPIDQAVPMVVEDRDGGALAGHYRERLKENNFLVLTPGEALPKEGEKPAAFRTLLIPEGFSEALLEKREVTLTYTGLREGYANDYDLLRLKRVSYTVLADLVVVAEAPAGAGGAGLAGELAALRNMERPLKLEVIPAGKRRVIPSGFSQAIPGTLVMFTLLVLLTSGTALLIAEREQQLLRRLASVPYSRGQIVAGKWAGRMALALVQIGFALMVGTAAFAMDWGSSLGMVLIVLLAWAALCTSLSLLLGSLAKSEGQGVGLGILVTMVMAAIGGCWWPIEVAPKWMQTLGLFVPTGWTMDALHKLINFDLGWQSALPHLGILAFAALAVGWLAARRFRFT